MVVSPTDLVGYLCCEHLSVLSLQVARGERSKPNVEDPELDVLTQRSLEHEHGYLTRLKDEGRSVTIIVDPTTGTPFSDLVAMEEATLDSLRTGPDVVYQATFFDLSGPGPAWRGHADFLTRIDRPSGLGEFSYEPEDTKLAGRVKPSAILQLCHYAEQLGRLQGGEPASIHVVLGGQERHSFALADFAAYYRAAKARFEAALTDQGLTYPNPVEHCAVCSWRTVCEQRRAADDHLCLVAGLSRDQARKLTEGAAIATMAALAAHDGSSVPKMRVATVDRLARQARLQVTALTSTDQPLPYELLSLDGPGHGLAALPEPDDGDLFFDIEGDPYEGDGGIEYLLGVGWMQDGRFEHRIFWAHDRAQEKAAFESFIDFVTERRRLHPNLHVYHYAPYERTALGRLMGRHATREEEVDDLFRGDFLVDLYRVVRQGICVGSPSYSLKKLEPLYMRPRTGEITDAGSSIVEYERWLETTDAQILDAIGDYNRTDCDSTRLLRDWLEDRRVELTAELGTEVPRPGRPEDMPGEAVTAEITGVAELAAQLTVGADGPTGDASPEAAACWLLAQLLDWHRREDKPEWWQYFARVLDYDDEDLWCDTEAIAGLNYEGVERAEKRSSVHRYGFDPTQEHKLSADQQVVDPASEREKLLKGTKVAGPGTLVELDSKRGKLWLKRGTSSVAHHPEALIPGGPVPTKQLREALRRLARSVLTNGIDGEGPYRAVRDLLLRRGPRLLVLGSGQPLQRDGEEATDAAVRLALALDGGCLAIQGPPGSGKTYSAARMVVALVAEGKRVGITASSHAVVGNLLAGVMVRGAEEGMKIRALQKADDDQRCSHADVTCTNSNEQVEAALTEGRVDVVAGTGWLFAREGLDATLDVLVIDEAGQLSLANAAAVGAAAHNLVLVGDPRQLAQPSKGTHPIGAGVSALEHLLANRATIAADQGLFLNVTRRLHPGICAFVSELAYDGRLHSLPECGRQTVRDGPVVGGSGLRWVPVDHAGNRTSSTEEATTLAEHYYALLGRPWTKASGEVLELRTDDLLVVAPYNAQVALLSEHLPSGARVGTVDKLQGQEAAVVLVSLTASSAEDIPRGMEFLYSRNRLNVAVSRARALAITIGSPHLLAVHCRTSNQLRLANGLCRLMELAS